MKFLRLVPLLLLGIAIPGVAQSFERLLLPIVPEQLQGGLGSQWVTDLAITNLSDAPLGVVGYEQAGGCPVLCGAPPPIPARATIFVKSTPRCPGVRGTHIFVERGRTLDLAVTLRSRDVSRQFQTWGTTIPVVAPDQLFGQRFGIVDVPIEPQFRSTLRLYDVNPATPPSVRLRFYTIDPSRDYPRNNASDTLLFEMTPTFSIPSGGGAFCHAYFEMAVSSIPTLTGAQRVRVEIDPLDRAKDYWGFISVTHNETQHVTVLAPK